MQASRIISLTQTAINVFKAINTKHYTPLLEQNKPDDMHFIANMLLDLVEIAYPLEEETEEYPYWEAYKSFVNFLREDNCPRIKIPTYEQWKGWMDAINGGVFGANNRL